MRGVLARLGLVLALLLAPTVAHAQLAGGAVQPTQQTATHADAASAVAHSHTSAATITLQNQTSGYIYITAIEITNCAGTTVTAATPLFITTTGVTGSPQYMVGTNGTAGMCNPASVISIGNGGLRQAAASTNVTFVLPTFTTQQTVSVNIYYYIAQY